MMQDTLLVIPCYNEEARLQTEYIHAFVNNYNCKLMLVNDGSTDNTLRTVETLADTAANIEYLHLPVNVGKAEAVRRAVMHLQNRTDIKYIGYFDADFSTPLTEAIVMRDFLERNPHFSVIYGSRVLRLGAKVVRSPLRHYLGRVFVTITYLFTKIKVYDSQCGAKLFRKEICSTLFGTTFVTRWLFDVEILKRLEQNNLLNKVYEYPVSEWVEKKGSKIKWVDFLAAPLELLKLHVTYKYAQNFVSK